MIVIVLIIAALILQSFGPWWLVLGLAFITCAWLGKSGKMAFWQSFLAIFVLWLGMSLYKSFPNEHILVTRVSEMFKIKVPYLFFLVNALIGGVFAGISGLCGYHFRKSIYPHKK